MCRSLTVSNRFKTAQIYGSREILHFLSPLHLYSHTHTHKASFTLTQPVMHIHSHTCSHGESHTQHTFMFMCTHIVCHTLSQSWSFIHILTHTVTQTCTSAHSLTQSHTQTQGNLDALQPNVIWPPVPPAACRPPSPSPSVASTRPRQFQAPLA